MKRFRQAAFVVALMAMAACAQSQQRLVPRPLPPLVQARGAEQPVRLSGAEVTVDASGSLARTTLLLTLYNPNDRLLEGTLQFPLQPGQRVAAFALDVDGVLRDAVAVPKAQARQVFESIERRNVDPALLEQVAGNHFRLRVYPIPPRGTRQVRLVLDEAMERDGDAWRLEVPVHLLAGADAFALHVRTPGQRSVPTVAGAFDALDFRRSAGGYVSEVARTDFRPETGLVLRFPADAAPRAYTAVVEGEHFVLAEVPVAPMPVRRRDLPSTVGLLWDASGSARHRDRAGEFALLDRYFAAMGDGTVVLRLLRDVGEDGGTFEIRAGNWLALRAVLEAAPLDGATNLADWTPEATVGEYLLVSDGLGNYDDGAVPALLHGQRLYALSSAGARADAGRLAAIAAARGGRLVSWHATDPVDRAADALLATGTRLVALEGEGVTDLVAEAPVVDDGMLRIAGRLTRPGAVIRARLASEGSERIVEVPVAASDAPSPQAASAWAAWRVSALSVDPARNREAIARIGRRFSLVTPGTSLLVLDDPMDYVRHDIPVPPMLREQVEALRMTWRAEREATRSEHLDRVAANFAQRIAWWEHEFPKTRPFREVSDARVDAAAVEERAASARGTSPSPAPMFAPPPPESPGDTTLDRIQVTGTRLAAEAGDSAGESEEVTVRLQPWRPDSPYARRLRDAAAEDLYTLYLDERDSHADSSAFYLDVADLLLERGRRAEGLRVLSNLAEMGLEDRHVLRVLGYRLAQADAWPLAVRVFRQVLAMAEEEPQSHRDLGLSLAEAGQGQEAIERLYTVVEREWDARFAEIELVALNELNRIVATSTEPLDTAFVDRRMLRNLPLDLRAVLSWDSDNSDMDLWVTDPNGEKCYYANPRTFQGGLMSDDFTGGYGPEEFLLRDAKPGTYRVEAHYFGDRQQVVTGATTLMLKLSTGWGTPRQQDHEVTLRLPEQDATVLVGEFEVR